MNIAPSKAAWITSVDIFCKPEGISHADIKLDPVDRYIGIANWCKQHTHATVRLKIYGGSERGEIFPTTKNLCNLTRPRIVRVACVFHFLINALRGIKVHKILIPPPSPTWYYASRAVGDAQVSAWRWRSDRDPLEWYAPNFRILIQQPGEEWIEGFLRQYREHFPVYGEEFYTNIRTHLIEWGETGI
jgi:hypothetical protein